VDTCSLSPDDWGVLYGFGLFETVRVYDGRAVFLDEHIDRLLASAALFGFDDGPGRPDIVDAAATYCRAFDDRVVRMTLTRGNTDAGLAPSLFFGERPSPYTDADRAAGVAVHITTTRRNETSPIAGHKTLNQLDNILAWREAQQHGCRESLFLNTSGHLAEGSRSNVFAVRNGEVFTPATSCGILPGITRRVVIAALRDAGVSVHECAMTLDDLLACDEWFLTSAVMEVMPVSRIADRHPRPPVPGATSISALAASAYRAEMRTA
jgi:branched-chain amino acid aminotransferase